MAGQDDEVLLVHEDRTYPPSLHRRLLSCAAIPDLFFKSDCWPPITYEMAVRHRRNRRAISAPAIDFRVVSNEKSRVKSWSKHVNCNVFRHQFFTRKQPLR